MSGANNGSALTRRALLAGAAGALGGDALAAEDGLDAAARAKGLTFGSAAVITPLRNDPAYGRALARECGMLACENETKMLYVLPRPDLVTYRGGDDTLAFARAHGMRMRGHTLVWHNAIPDWVLPRITRDRAESFLRQWIASVAGHFRGRFESWDVVNEILAPIEGRPDGLRNTPWLAALGPRYVDLAFEILREVDPAAAGVWNEDDCEQGEPWMDARRALVLRTLEGLLKRGVPIHRFGMQSHIYSTFPLDAGKLRAFLREIAGMGLGIEITELDIDDRAYPADPATRDRRVAEFGRRFLDVVLDEPAVLNVVTWNITDRGTWLNASPIRRRPDGLPQRGLPLDDAYRRKPLWTAMRQAFRDAPDHSVARAKLRTKRS
ncbi:endo-1,4-beta-xylanase [Methylobacterium sp. A54F]